MRACPRCGTPNLDAAASCAACGSVFEGSGARPAVSRGLKQTMLGFAAPALPEQPDASRAQSSPAAPGPASPPQPPGLGSTLPHASPREPRPSEKPQPQPAAQVPVKSALHQQTMLGVARP